MRIDEVLGSKNRPSPSQTFFNFVFRSPAPGPSLATTNNKNTYYYEGKFDRSQSDFCLLQHIFYTCFQIKLQVQTDLLWLQIVIGMIESVIAREGACNKSKKKVQQQNRGRKRLKDFSLEFIFPRNRLLGLGVRRILPFFSEYVEQKPESPFGFSLASFLFTCNCNAQKIVPSLIKIAIENTSRSITTY